MPFGKHKGRPLESLPKGYLGWLRRKVPMGEELRNEVIFVLDGTRPIGLNVSAEDLDRLITHFDTEDEPTAISIKKEKSRQGTRSNNEP
jgi:hypothetical protein